MRRRGAGSEAGGGPSSSSSSSSSLVGAPEEALETEGQRQLRSLLRRQLHPEASVQQCVSKRGRFAPAAVYRPFGEEASGARSLTEFRALQESSREAAALRELGLADAEIRLWKSRAHAAAEKGSGLGAAPEAMQDRIQAIQEKIAERQRILSLPQRFAGSKQLSRREMEIENALFQGTDRHAFLKMLYHHDGAERKVGGGKDPLADLEAAYQEVLGHKPPKSPQAPQKDSGPPCPNPPSNLPAVQIAGQQPMMVTEPVAFVSEEEIQQNRLSEEELCEIPKFSSYNPGEPSEVLYLKNLSRRVTVRDLLSVFARFQGEGGPQIQFRLLSGRMRGQAFLTFPSVSMAQAALELANGFKLLGKPLVIEYGRSKRQAGSPDLEAVQDPQQSPAP